MQRYFIFIHMKLFVCKTNVLTIIMVCQLLRKGRKLKGALCDRCWGFHVGSYLIPQQHRQLSSFLVHQKSIRKYALWTQLSSLDGILLQFWNLYIPSMVYFLQVICSLVDSITEWMICSWYFREETKCFQERSRKKDYPQALFTISQKWIIKFVNNLREKILAWTRIWTRVSSSIYL